MDAVLVKFSTEELRLACQRGDIETVRECIDRGAQINDRRSFDPNIEISLALHATKTPLYIACENNRFEVVELLLAHGASPRIADGRWQTPLFIASVWGHSRIVRRLLLEDSDLNHRSTNGSTPLLAAVSSGLSTCCADCVRTLLERGAAVDMPDHSGWSPLVVAVESQKYYHGAHNLDERQRFVDMARMLLTHGADFDWVPSQNRSWRKLRWRSPTDFSSCATPLQRVRKLGDPAMNALFDCYLFSYFLLRIRLCVIGPCAPRPAPRRRGLFGRLVARRNDVGGARYGLVDEPHLARHVASFLVG
ncbi:unnamed protein product [Pelagomonas calceolata]|uniref:Uncharacterized protein n=1 Tax=Pelagomonas calceolata TaxID=35677 RepID=A0A8J2SYF0_9STRA|nr:unnamed protein product [Pelagomonas calceolata]